MAVVGSSYGGYLAAILTSHAPGALARAARAGAVQGHRTGSCRSGSCTAQQDLDAYRRLPVRPEESRALRACAAFTGDVLIVESEHDLDRPAPGAS